MTISSHPLARAIEEEHYRLQERWQQRSIDSSDVRERVLSWITTAQSIPSIADRDWLRTLCNYWNYCALDGELIVDVRPPKPNLVVGGSVVYFGVAYQEFLAAGKPFETIESYVDRFESEPELELPAFKQTTPCIGQSTVSLESIMLPDDCASMTFTKSKKPQRSDFVVPGGYPSLFPTDRGIRIGWS